MNIRELFVADVSKWWKMWSVWIFGAVGVLPDAYNSIAAMGWLDELPTPAKWILRGLAATGIVFRLMRQKPRGRMEGETTPSSDEVSK